MSATTDPSPPAAPTTAALPVVDISRFRGPAAERAALLRELRDAAREVGFFSVVGHGVSPELRAQALTVARRFFALPEEERLEIENIRSPQFRGYTRTGTEYTAGGPDWREQIDIGPERPALRLGPDDPAYLRLVGPNQWPRALPELRDIVLRWQAEALRVSREVLRALAAALGQEDAYFDRWFDDEAAVHVKVVRYPGRPAAEVDQGVGAHKDYGYLALLQQDDVGGLQVQARDGSWIDVAPLPDAFVFNIGEMLEIATRGYLRATRHRVVAPPPGVDRYSIPFFLGPRLDAVVEPLVLPDELAAQADGVTDDPDNPLKPAFGENALVGWLRSHPRVVDRWWKELRFGDTVRPGPAFETLQVHAGAAPDPATGARAVPLYLTAGYTFRDAGHAADAFALADLETHAYTRVSNPTTAAAEARIAALEGGTAAVAVGSGQAATALSLLNLARAGDHIIAAASLYGGTRTLLEHTFADLGIQATFVDDPGDTDAWRRAVRPETRALFAESVGNPRGQVLDIAAVADVAHEAGVPLVIDNTLPTPYLLRPFDHGADIVVHSTTKFLAGHGTAIGGVIVDGGRFDFGARPERWPGLVAPDPTYDNLSFWDRFGADGIAYALRLRVRLLRDLGPATSPLNSFLLLQGLDTLSLRVARHTANAERVAAWLDRQPGVLRVDHPSLPSSPWHEAARRYLPRGAGAVLAVELDGGLEAGRRFVEGLRLFSHLANIGDVRSLAIHPASTTHAQLDEAQQRSAGLAPGLVRLSIGLEGTDDLIADLRQGLRNAAGTRA